MVAGACPHACSRRFFFTRVVVLASQTAKKGLVQGTALRVKYVVPPAYQDRLRSRSLWLGVYRESEGLAVGAVTRLDKAEGILELDTTDWTVGHAYVVSLKEGKPGGGADHLCCVHLTCVLQARCGHSLPRTARRAACPFCLRRKRSRSNPPPPLLRRCMHCQRPWPGLSVFRWTTTATIPPPCFPNLACVALSTTCASKRANTSHRHPRPRPRVCRVPRSPRARHLAPAARRLELARLASLCRSRPFRRRAPLRPRRPVHRRLSEAAPHWCPQCPCHRARAALLDLRSALCPT